LELHGVFCWQQNQGAIAGEHNGKRRFLRVVSGGLLDSGRGRTAGVTNTP
jgi:hypothetical protein